MKIAFRTDASIKIGTGHVMRCLRLAEALRAKGVECFFICRKHAGHLFETIRQRGFDVYGLTSYNVKGSAAKIEEGENLPSHLALLGVSWEQDLEQTLKVLTRQAVDWLIVDHYALDARWERQVTVNVGRIMVVDDLADRFHHADLLLDQNVLSSQGEEHYRMRVNSECKLMLGPRYALLGQEYPFLSEALPERDGQILRAMVFVGGSDPHHLTERYLKAISVPEFGHIQLDVVVGRNHPAPTVVAEMVSQRPNTRFYSSLPSLAPLMVRADLMLGAGGATNWERMCLGLISIVVSVAPNQDEINRDLAGQGLIHFLGKAESLSLEKIRSTFRLVLKDQQGNCDRSRGMRKLVDGRGCQRVIDNLINKEKL